MRPIAVSVDIAAPPTVVWERLADLSSYSQWMNDAVSISFVTDQRRGIGVRMKVPTRVGPLRTVDLMEIDEWIEEKRLGVRHAGRIGGWGRFELSDNPPGSRLTWVEQLRFPWYMGGVLAKWAARSILRRIFQADLVRFQQWVETELGQEG